MLEIGSTALDLALEDTAGEVVRLSDYRGTEHVLLYFMRSTTCPVCTGHVKDLARRTEELAAAGVRVLIAVPEGRAEAAAWRAKRGLSLRVVTGRNGTPHEAFGLAKKMLQQSGSVLIDRDGVVRHAHASTMPTGAYDKKGIAEAVAAL
ncbi:peroxiredoxin family protein [Amycolatopsis azurea]|uniref:thioredoxin-dependent peroxiredoxin n=1 Tax=Amycolatopsis azurea DSM 43854 TaxID=1238180 RepID=M2QBX1_9PSEU|nr:peroxiredoxin family protein [Amycolatopsis azurea]EMD29535.1 Alkyl hydroperoxide reductase subunit C-like protein [Amycolatopsis azurea DSM 43854]OOC02691.1 peroxiredoxin [Amycolatopsis azurea DSM 43854]